MLPPLDPGQRVWVDRTLASLTLREKIGQTFQDHAGRLQLGEFNETNIRAYLQRYPVGSFFVGGEVIKGADGAAESVRDRVRMLQKESRVPLLVSGDLEAGAGAAVQSLTKFPNMMALAAADNEQLAYELGKYTALEGRAAGFTWALAPQTDILLNWLNPVVTTRCLGDDKGRVAYLSAAVVKGMQEHGLAACAKHFPGDGVDYRDQHIVTTVNHLPEEAWWSSFGEVFRRVIDEGVLTVMTGHIALPWLEGKQPKPVPATVSSKVTTDLLRRRLGFQGVILSDALDMGGFVGWDTYERRIIDCFNAGTDVLLWPGRDYIWIMETAVADGRVSLTRLDESARRVLELKARLGLHHLDSEGRDPLAPSLAGGTLSGAPHRQAKWASAEIAQRSITLVRNRKGLLPLNPDTMKRALIVKLNKVTDGRVFAELDGFIDRLAARGIQLGIVEDFEPLTNVRSKVLAQAWDAVLVPFLLPMHGLLNTVRPTGEAAKGIWSLQQVEQAQPIIISLATPYLLHDMPFADTLVNAYSASPDTLDYLVRALFGEIPFRGRSPVKIEDET